MMYNKPETPECRPQNGLQWRYNAPYNLIIGLGENMANKRHTVMNGEQGINDGGVAWADGEAATIVSG